VLARGVARYQPQPNPGGWSPNAARRTREPHKQPRHQRTAFVRSAPAGAGAAGRFSAGLTAGRARTVRLDHSRTMIPDRRKTGDHVTSRGSAILAGRVPCPVRPPPPSRDLVGPGLDPSRSGSGAQGKQHGLSTRARISVTSGVGVRRSPVGSSEAQPDRQQLL